MANSSLNADYYQAGENYNFLKKWDASEKMTEKYDPINNGVFEKYDSNKVKDKKDHSKSVNNIFMIVIIFLSLVLAGELVFHFYIAPRLMIEKVRISEEGQVLISDSDLLEMAGLKSRQYYFLLDEKLVKARLEANPVIESAEIKKIFPDTLSITVKTREALCLSFVEAGGMSVPVVFDENGIIFQIGASIADWNLPIISGINIKEVKLGTKLPEELYGFFGELNDVKKNSPALFSLISELKFVRKSNADFEVLIFPLDKKLRVRISNEISVDLLKYIMMVLNVLDEKSLDSNINEIDFRTGEIVYRIRED